MILNLIVYVKVKVQPLITNTSRYPRICTELRKYEVQRSGTIYGCVVGRNQIKANLVLECKWEYAH